MAKRTRSWLLVSLCRNDGFVAGTVQRLPSSLAMAVFAGIGKKPVAAG